MSRVNNVLSCIGLPASQAVSTGEENAVLRKAVGDANAPLIGVSSAAKVEVDMWLSFSQRTVNQDTLSALNATLLYKTYLVGNCVTLADFSVLVALSTIPVASYQNIHRWFNHIRSLAKSFECTPANTPTAIVHTLIPVPMMDGQKGVELAGKSAVDAPVPTAAPTAVAAVAAAATPASSSSDNKKKDTSKAKAEKAPVASAAPVATAAAVEKEESGAGLDPTKLDIRAGRVLKCWNHPDSEKLLCEEVDMGGGEVRCIASGIRAFYSAEEVQGRMVMVLCNLKERSIAGFKSQVLGYFMCGVWFVCLFLAFLRTYLHCNVYVRRMKCYRFDNIHF